jgi:hypothetical protein
MYTVTNEDLALGAVVFMAISNIVLYYAWSAALRSVRKYKRQLFDFQQDHFCVKLDDPNWSLQRGPDGKIIFAIFKYPEIQEMERRRAEK